MKKLISASLILILFSAMFTGCNKDNGLPPALPPAESLSIDFSNFITLKKGGDNTTLKGTNNSNWDFVVGVAVTWKTLVALNLAIPVSAFKLAADQDPVFVSDKTWQWSYNVTASGVTYKARLTGQISTSDVLWKMYISKEGTGAFAEFVWIDGTSKLDGTGGQWIFNQNAQSPEAYLQIDWTKTGTSVGSVKYSYVKNLDAFKTSYIEYGLTTSALNAYYNIHYWNQVKFSDVMVEWNTTTLNGRVQCLDQFKDSNWHSWDSNKLNN